jgi:hypothetical protein
VKSKILFLTGLLLTASGCGTGQVASLPSVSGTDPSTFALGLAVGTANIAGPNGNQVAGLNVVATFRAPGGQNATLANSPTLSGPAKFGTNPDGTTQNDLSAPTPTQILAAASSSHPSAPAGALGSLIGVYGYGFAPLNIVAVAPNETLYGTQQCDGFALPSWISASIRYDALALPLDAGHPCGANSYFMPLYGGPPAWPSAEGYGIPTGDPSTGEYFHGYPLGYMDLDYVKPVRGQYVLNVQFATSPDGTQYGYNQAVANLTSTKLLPAIATPTLTIHNDGSGTVFVNVPPGVTEALVEIAASYCPRQSVSSHVLHYYSLLTHQTGPQTLTLTNNLGPPVAGGSTPTDTFCTAADDVLYGKTTHTYTVEAIGFDYPAFEASYPQSTSLLPPIANAAGQADITTSAPFFSTYVLGSSALRAPAKRRY